MPKKERWRSGFPMDTHDLHCRDASCLFCLIKEPDVEKRQSSLAQFFKDLPSRANSGQAFVVAGLWNVAMKHPNDVNFVELGVFECMASLIWKGIKDRRWLLQDHNISIPYYAAHIIGSYTMEREDFAERAVKEGVIPPLVELLRGRLTWVEQRVAVRALGHIATYHNTFPSIAGQAEVLELAMELAVSSLEIVYTHFIQFEEKRLSYHRELLTRGMGGAAMESRKAEEWASQLQCWALQFINCFAFKDKYVASICRPSFLTKLPEMWGGLANQNSPAGVGLLRTICHHKLGRSSVAACPSIVQALCNIARSSDDWQRMAVECLLLLLQDSGTRQRVMDMAAVALVDLVDLPSIGDRKKLGSQIVDALLQDDTQSPSSFLRGSLSARARRLLDELASQRQRMKWEKSLSKEDLLAKQQGVLELKLEGNIRFSTGDVATAVSKYTEALALCPARDKKERIVLHSNRAQCYLLLQDPEAAISDTTRALCIFKPVNCHGKSLWRRAQAYDMMGLAKESLLDAVMFINECTNLAERNASLNQPAVPDYAEDLVMRQMQAAWLFKDAAMKHGGKGEGEGGSKDGGGYEDSKELEGDSDWETVSESEQTTIEEEEEVEEEYESPVEDCISLRERQKLASRSRKLLLSLQGTTEASSALPTIREESFREGESRRLVAGEGKQQQQYPVHLDKELLKKSIYDLIQQKFLLHRGRGAQKPMARKEGV